MPQHPMQPVVLVDGVQRFMKNNIVSFMLEELSRRGMDLNTLQRISGREGFTADDWAQFSQLHGYSVSGWGTLSFVTDEAWDRNQAVMEGASQAEARIKSLEGQLEAMKQAVKALRAPLAGLFGVHEEDFPEPTQL